MRLPLFVLFQSGFLLMFSVQACAHVLLTQLFAWLHLALAVAFAFWDGHML